ncbi:hypothetical protein [Streptococcus loxodontisalivarius]|uniref:ABC transporter permease n=1 Tax=Streptococcus loxodontisalivarius TaxID=1349415 RepID=A0ABS2PU62_9STRE|nr:hypothetical protein [Streptococcus loxodontisalivarius]MBM7643584.1 hypothetical protein [Streptococcus loxodontisalivarius]
MDMKRVLLYSYYQIQNQLRGMSLTLKAFWVLDWFDSFLQPLFFALIFFVVNPSNQMIFFFGFLPLLFNSVNGLDVTQRILSDRASKRSFQLVGFSEKEYARGNDIVSSMRVFLSNLIYSLTILLISYFQYPQLFLPILLIDLCLLAIQPLVFIWRYHLLAIPGNLLTLVSKFLTFQTMTIVVLIINIRRLLDVDSRLFVLVALLCLLVLGLVFFLKRLIVKAEVTNAPLLMEFKIALNENGSAPLAILLIPIACLFLAIYLTVKIRTEIPLTDNQNHFNVIGLAYTYLPLALLMIIQIGLIYYYSYDLEGERMRRERYMGDFIRYKVRNKLYLAYVLSLPFYVIYLISFLIFCATSLEETLAYLFAYTFGFALQPLFFFFTSLLFPKQKETLLGLDQGTSNLAQYSAIVISLGTSMISAYYMANTRSFFSLNTFYMLLIFIVLVLVLRVLMERRIVQLEE